MIPNRVVLDTNVCLDLFVFRDRECEVLGNELRAGRIHAVTRSDCRREWEVVLDFPHLPLDDAGRRRAAEEFDAFIACLSVEETARADILLPVCKDRADQKFLEAARDARASVLITKDKALLKLAKRTKRAGLFSILRPPEAAFAFARSSAQPLPECPMTPALESRLPDVGTTIFSVMSALAAEYGAVNLGQGFPDFDCAPELVHEVTAAMTSGRNQYAPMHGVTPLRQAIASKILSLYGRGYDAEREITVTAGATQALLTAILCSVRPGDEVIVIEPVYDSYVPSIALAGGKAVPVQMELDDTGFRIPWDKVAAAVTRRTRMIILNSPHNPTGSVTHASDIASLCDIVRGTNIVLLSDEVYEHMVFDGRRHESMCRYPELAERAFIVSSFGKTYHVTGWKVGYVAAPSSLTAEFRKVHQFNVFAVNTPVQFGLAAYMADPAPYLDLPAFYQRKRDFFRAGLEGSRFRLLPCEGTYFQCVAYSGMSPLRETDFAKWLTTQAGVAAIPLSPFYRDGKESGIVRFCFAKNESTLAAALSRLASL